MSNYRHIKLGIPHSSSGSTSSQDLRQYTHTRNRDIDREVDGQGTIYVASAASVGNVAIVGCCSRLRIKDAFVATPYSLKLRYHYILTLSGTLL